MNRGLPDITESSTELKDRLRGESVGYKKQRLTALYLLQSGNAKNRKQVADLIGVNRQTVGHWLDAYQAGGIDQMLDRRYPPGRVPLLSEAQRHELRAELDKPSGFSSYGEIQQFIASTYQVEMSYKAVYSLIHDKWGAKPKVPRKSHKKKRDTNPSLRFDLSIPSRRCYFRKTESVGSPVLPRRIETWHFARCPKKNHRLWYQTGGNR